MSNIIKQNKNKKCKLHFKLIIYTKKVNRIETSEIMLQILTLFRVFSFTNLEDINRQVKYASVIKIFKAGSFITANGKPKMQNLINQKGIEETIPAI